VVDSGVGRRQLKRVLDRQDEEIFAQDGKES